MLLNRPGIYSYKSDSAPHNKMAARFKRKAIINGFPKVYLGHRLKQASDLQIW